MTKSIPRTLLLDHEELTCLALAANDAVVIVNDIQGISTNTVQLGFGEEDIPVFDGQEVRHAVIGTYVSGMYPLIDVILNCKPVETGEHKIVPLFHVAINLAPPYEAGLIRTDGVLDDKGEYNLADNETAHAPIHFSDGLDVSHPDYLDLLLTQGFSDPLNLDQANELITVLDIPKTLLLERLKQVQNDFFSA